MRHNEQKVSIFIDMDGVVFDFEGYFADHFGFRHDSVTDEKMWELINSHPAFFSSLPLYNGAIDFYRMLNMRFDTFFLTACPKTNYRSAAMQKIDAVKRLIDVNAHILPVLGGRNKMLFMRNAGDVLIDDFNSNIKAWKDAGGVGIVHKSFDDTSTQLRKLNIL